MWPTDKPDSMHWGLRPAWTAMHMRCSLLTNFEEEIVAADASKLESERVHTQCTRVLQSH